MAYDTYQLIVQYEDSAYYAASQGDNYFLVEEKDGEEVKAEQLTGRGQLYDRALALLNDDPRADHEEVYLPEESIENYFQDVEEIKDVSGCYSAKAAGKKFIIIPRYLIEDGPLDPGHYLPLLAAHLYPEGEEEASLLILLKEMLEQ